MTCSEPACGLRSVYGFRGLVSNLVWSSSCLFGRLGRPGARPPVRPRAGEARPAARPPGASAGLLGFGRFRSVSVGLWLVAVGLWFWVAEIWFRRGCQNPLQNNTISNDFGHFLAPGGPGPVSKLVFNLLWCGLGLFGLGFNLGLVFVLFCSVVLAAREVEG